jgi:hypothetical protein
MCHSWPGNAREIERYSTNLGNAGNWSKNSGIREATVLDKWLSETATDFMLVLRPREYRSGNYLQSMALSVLSKFKENYANKQFDHFDLNRFHELANSLKLLVLLSNIKPSYEIPGVHLPNVPLWLLKYPEALPKCYDPMILCTQKGPGNPINLIEFLSEMAKHGLGHSSSVFGEWVREIDDPSLPFDDAWLEWIGQMPDSLPSYGDWVEPKGAPVDVLPDHPTPEAVANSTDVVHAPFKKGKPGPTNRRIPDEKLVIILREACKHFGTPRNSKNAERFLWHQLDTEVGKKIYNTQAALSQRVRNIDNLNWRGEAQTLLKQVFGSIK